MLIFIADNAKTWYAQRGFAEVDPVLHGSMGISGS